MGKSGVLFIFLFLLPLTTALTIDMKSNYGQGETILARISGNFADALQEKNVFLYKGRFNMPIDYDVAKIGDDYYVRMSLIGKSPNNYSFQIRNIRYYDAGILVDDDVVKNFTISSTYADFAIDPGFVITRDNFEVEVQSLQSSQSLTITPPTGITSLTQTTLGPGQVKDIVFDISGLTQSILGTLIINSGTLSYTLPISVYVPPTDPDPDPEPDPVCTGDQWCIDNVAPDFICNASGSCVAAQPECSETIPCPSGQICDHGVCVQDTPPDPDPEPEPYCGDGEINVPGEVCDGDEFGSVNGCADYGFNSGEITCNAPGTVNECKIDTADCSLVSEVECTEANQETTCGANKVCISNRCTDPSPEPEQEEALCGNGGINMGELCDGTNWGRFTGCISLGFDKGSLSCGGDCMFDTSQCENNPPQTLSTTCTSGTDCNYTHECIQSTCIAKIAVDCLGEDECLPAESCIHGKCVLVTGGECSSEADCPSPYEECKPNGVCGVKLGDECNASLSCNKSYQECISGYCIGDPECIINEECDNGWECVEDVGECWPQEEIIECSNSTEDTNCTSNQICVKGTCLDIGVQCRFDRNCGEGLECYEGECKEKEDLPDINRSSTKTCPETQVGGKDGKRCKSNERCDGSTLQILGSSCCFGDCIEKDDGGGSSWIGWALIIFVGLILIIFFMKYKKARRPRPNLAKIGLRR